MIELAGRELRRWRWVGEARWPSFTGTSGRCFSGMLIPIAAKTQTRKRLSLSWSRTGCNGASGCSKWRTELQVCNDWKLLPVSQQKHCGPVGDRVLISAEVVAGWPLFSTTRRRCWAATHQRKVILTRAAQTAVCNDLQRCRLMTSAMNYSRISIDISAQEINTNIKCQFVWQALHKHSVSWLSDHLNVLSPRRRLPAGPDHRQPTANVQPVLLRWCSTEA